MVERDGVSSDWLAALPPRVREFPADLAFVDIFTLVATIVVFLPGISDSPVRVAAGLPLVLVLPGYAVTAALFPGRGTLLPTPEEFSEDGGSGPPGPEETGTESARVDVSGRLALSIGLSIAVVTVVGLGVNFLPWGFELAPIMVIVATVTLGSVSIAARRRSALPESQQFTVPYREWFEGVQRELFDTDTRAHAALNVLLVASVLLAVGSVGYAVSVPAQDGGFTEFYLLSETEEGSEVADDFPRNFTEGESQPVVIGIDNQEHERQEYVVVVTLQRVQVQTNATAVVSDRELDRLETPTLAHNETWHRNYSVTPTMVGDRLRLGFLLYRGSVPEDPTLGNADSETHLWINVSE